MTVNSPSTRPSTVVTCVKCVSSSLVAISEVAARSVPMSRSVVVRMVVPFNGDGVHVGMPAVRVTLGEEEEVLRGGMGCRVLCKW